MKKILLFLVAGVVIIGVANSRSDTEGTARAGSAAVYEQIASETSCSALQGTFDRADATAQRPGSFGGERWIDIGIDYMEAADTRMRQIGCY